MKNASCITTRAQSLIRLPNTYIAPPGHTGCPNGPVGDIVHAVFIVLLSTLGVFEKSSLRRAERYQKLRSTSTFFLAEQAQEKECKSMHKFKLSSKFRK